MCMCRLKGCRRWNCTALQWLFALFQACFWRRLTPLLPSSPKELTDGFSSWTVPLSQEAKAGPPALSKHSHSWDDSDEGPRKIRSPIFSVLAWGLCGGWPVRGSLLGHPVSSSMPPHSCLSQNKPAWLCLQLGQGGSSSRERTQPLQLGGLSGGPPGRSQHSHPQALSRGCGGLTFVTEPIPPAGFALAKEVAHEVLADLGPLLVAGLWIALVRQVWEERKEITVLSCSRPAGRNQSCRAAAQPLVGPWEHGLLAGEL